MTEQKNRMDSQVSHEGIAQEQLNSKIEADSLKYCIQDQSLGAGGYDLVNYFTNNAAELGVKEYSSTYEGIEYHFKNQDHLDLFTKNPSQYLPAYGGWCSMTLAMGRATTPTYDNFKIIDGELHLFERTLSVNGQLLWIANPDENATLAGENYSDYRDDGIIEAN